MIIQGTNKPIIIEFLEDMSFLQYISVSLVNKESKDVMKHWGISDVEIDGELVQCPQKQEESMEYIVGSCEILIKWLGIDNKTEFSEKIRDKVVEWNDRTVLGVV